MASLIYEWYITVTFRLLERDLLEANVGDTFMNRQLSIREDYWLEDARAILPLIYKEGARCWKLRSRRWNLTGRCLFGFVHQCSRSLSHSHRRIINCMLSSKCTCRGHRLISIEELLWLSWIIIHVSGSRCHEIIEDCAEFSLIAKNALVQLHSVLCLSNLIDISMLDAAIIHLR